MTRRPPLTLDQLPLLASDDQIAEAIVGPDRAKTFLARLPTLEKDGFPPRDPFFEGRYVPRVKAFFEIKVGKPGMTTVVQDRQEGTWQTGRPAKRRA